VALKLMRHRHQFVAEIEGRLSGGEALPADVVMGLLGWHTPPTEGFTSSIGREPEAEPTPCAVRTGLAQYPYVLALTCGERSLQDACSKERIAGYNHPVIQSTLLSSARCLSGLHASWRIHGDFKERNLVRLDGQWVLCDLDASALLGQLIGAKTSTAYCPPELARIRFAAGDVVHVVAQRSFDIWSFGVVMFGLCSGHTLFRQDINNDELVEIEDQTRLCTWRTISDEELAPVFADPEADFGGLDGAQVAADAHHLIRWCLQGNPDDRKYNCNCQVRNTVLRYIMPLTVLPDCVGPTMAQIVAHPFFDPKAVIPRAMRMSYHAFMSHAQADASSTAAAMYFAVRARPGRLSGLSVLHSNIVIVRRFCKGAQGV
jgi:serine/threonine protein kinase